MERHDMLMKLCEHDFTAIDLQLYLDTHPDDKKAIEHYNTAVNSANKARAEYEKAFGPLASFVTPSRPDMFTYIDEPWPWQSAAARQ